MNRRLLSASWAARRHYTLRQHWTLDYSSEAHRRGWVGRNGGLDQRDEVLETSRSEMIRGGLGDGDEGVVVCVRIYSGLGHSSPGTGPRTPVIGGHRVRPSTGSIRPAETGSARLVCGSSSNTSATYHRKGPTPLRSVINASIRLTLHVMHTMTSCSSKAILRSSGSSLHPTPLLDPLHLLSAPIAHCTRPMRTRAPLLHAPSVLVSPRFTAALARAHGLPIRRPRTRSSNCVSARTGGTSRRTARATRDRSTARGECDRLGVINLLGLWRAELRRKEVWNATATGAVGRLLARRIDDTSRRRVGTFATDGGMMGE